MINGGITITKMSNNKSKEDYAACNNFNKKYCVAWSPLDQNKSLTKHRYVMCTRSAPNGSKRLSRCRIRRCTTFDGNFHNSSTDNSSFEEDKHLSRSAKIMRALNFNSSPTYYGKTRIKKSLNFNLPSPKRFTPVRNTIRKSLSLNFISPLSGSHKLNFSNKSSDSINSSYLFSSSESIDENQNEASTQENTKEHEMLHYSTPNAKLARNPVQSPTYTPLLRTRLKDMIADIVSATPTSVPKDTSECSNISMSTSRNLYNEFYDDNDRPTTPENVVHIFAESLSAIKKSHRKERLRRTGRCTTLCMNNFVNDNVALRNRSNSLSNQHVDLSQEFKTNVEPYISKNFELELTHCEDDTSETGSLFNYTKEQEDIVQEFKNVSDSVLDYANVSFEAHETDIKVESEENMQISDVNQSIQDYNSPDTKNLANNNIDTTVDVRAVTPEPTTETALNTQITVTPENRINILQKIANDSIKRSHKKVKEDKRKFFTPKILKLEPVQKQQNIKYLENIGENKISIEENSFHTLEEERPNTPVNVNSSRLLLTQFSSIKKSHRKDKHNKIVAGFLKRQKYFNRDMDLATTSTYKPISVDTSDRRMEDSSLDLGVTNIENSVCDTSRDSELQELDSPKENFQIFSPLRRKKPLIGSTVPKEYFCPYDSTRKNEFSKNNVAEINYSRCLTPVLNVCSSNSIKVEVNDTMEIKSDCSHFIPISNDADVQNFDSNDTTGRSTPRNMSTTELYSNLNSIKKSHRKNKRGNMRQKYLNINNRNDNNKSSIEEDIDSRVFNLSNDCIALDEVTNKSIDYNDTEASRSFVSDNESCPSTSAENISSSMTPPNCLKTKHYMRLIQNTSIKQSHKKVRNKKRQELAVEKNELSDSGSIFDDEEKLAFPVDSKYD